MSDHNRAEEKAWKAFSRMIRARDEAIEGYFKCPTCGGIKPIDQADAGHYITRVRKATMFDEKNVHAQCRHCNRFQEGNHFIYRKWLVEKYGAEAVEEMEKRARTERGYNTTELLQLAKEYRAREKAIRERRKNEG